MKSARFTIIIPTRERCETLYHTLRTCVDQDYDNLCIVISDNFSHDKTRAVVASFRDTRIQYVNTERRVSMTANFEFGLSQARDGFVMIIGDDDGLLPGAIQRVDRIADEHGVKAITSATCLYVWPDHPDVARRNSISWGGASTSVEIRRSSEWINRVLSFVPTYVSDLPGLYGGFVHTDVVRSMMKNGVFFRSMTPDAYSAFACAVALGHYAHSCRPFFIAGASGRSNGASYLLGLDRSESVKYFSENTIPFHYQLRLCPSYRVIAAEAFLQLKDAFPEKTTSYSLDVPRLLVSVLGEANERNGAAIRQAVSEMAQLHGVPMESSALAGLSRHRKVADRLRSLRQLSRTLFRYSAIEDVSRFGATNVYDAAKVANVFLELNEGAQVIRVLQPVLRGLLNRFKR